MKFGTKIDGKSVKSVPLPLTFQIQQTGYIEVATPQDVKDWEERIQQFHGVDPRKLPPNITMADTCSGGCLDDCGYLL